jgi:hypothetical protein
VRHAVMFGFLGAHAGDGTVSDGVGESSVTEVEEPGANMTRQNKNSESERP